MSLCELLLGLVLAIVLVCYVLPRVFPPRFDLQLPRSWKPHDFGTKEER